MNRNVHSEIESLFSMEQFQKQVVSLKSSEVYLFVDIKYVDVMTKGSIGKINSEMLCTAGIQCHYGAIAQ